MAGPGDEPAAAAGRSRGHFLASHADREQAVEVLKVAFVQERLAKAGGPGALGPEPSPGMVSKG